MENAIATVCLSGGLSEKLLAIAGAGFRNVELFENDLLSFNGTPREVRRMIDDMGLKTITFQPFRDFEGMPSELRARVFQRAERKFDVMQELGCDLLMICSNVSPHSLGGIDRASADLRDLGELAAGRGLRIAFEALSWGRHIYDYRDAWEAVRRADHPNVGLVLDSFHILARKTDLGAIRSIPADRIFLVQMADAPLLDMDFLSWSRHYRSFPGQGDLPLDAFMQALLATGYDGLLSLEIFNDQFRAGSARSVAIDGHRSLIAMLDQIQAGQPKGRRVGPLLPRKPKCLGTEFVEFAIDEESALRFERLLAGLGFGKTGEHVSKSVTRWNQGEINIVVNTEKEGFAHSFNIVHGTAVCALALRVDDAKAALDRAQVLLDQPFRQAVGPGELEIPAVRGLGGSLVYFTDPKSQLARVWDIDFAPLGGTGARQDAGLVAIDHISQSMRYEEMLTWLLFYKSLLDLSKLPEQDVLDPGGLVKSQVLQSEDGALRLILNASQSAQTLSSRFLDEAFGSGVQHIAFASRDIFATARALAANGVEVLPIPVNYYDDLEAKSDLSPAAIDELKALNILYERDGEAEYYQLYTHTFANRFFFEIVERRGGYRGFGASNAQIRLAAQARLNPLVVD
ncbi:MAG: sugar phosphate isomerase/epimerase and 4-hydroxyphenylpyruvate domain-containing protein [Alphaproteobacteria bacterium]|nr:MAG: sugar phosphate isomerase/epimerase and 4-hydroxyphenylpyruvate domain-containing protein [Alphaproteobacteria bacterium]